MPIPRIFPIFWRFGSGSALCVALWACGAKEAADPHSMIGEEGENGDSERGTRDPPTEKGPPEKLANAAECQAAARRIQELALDLAVKEAPPEEREQVEARKREELGSDAFKARVSEGSKECLANETSARDAQCIARAKTETDVDRCGSH